MTDELRSLIKEKNKLRRIAKRSGDRNDLVEFRRIRNLVKTRIRDPYNKYNFNAIKNNGKSEDIWHVLKKLKLISNRKKLAEHNFPAHDLKKKFVISTFHTFLFLYKSSRL